MAFSSNSGLYFRKRVVALESSWLFVKKKIGVRNLGVGGVILRVVVMVEAWR